MGGYNQRLPEEDDWGAAQLIGKGKKVNPQFTKRERGATGPACWGEKLGVAEGTCAA